MQLDRFNFNEQAEYFENGRGPRVRHTISLGSVFKNSNGSPISNMSDPEADVTSGVFSVSWNADDAGDSGGVFHFQLPGNYDDMYEDGQFDGDCFKVHIWAKMSGTTDTNVPLTLTAKYIRAGASSATTLTGGTFTIADDDLAMYTVDLSAQGLQAYDCISIVLSHDNADHTTDDLHVYGIQVEYRANFVLTDTDAR